MPAHRGGAEERLLAWTFPSGKSLLTPRHENPQAMLFDR